MVVLSEVLIKGKTRLDRLEDVKNLNLCGQGISDVSVLSQAPNIEVLSLSVNKIASLRHFAFCGQLKQLYLRSNEVSDLADIRYLMSLPHLNVLWLADNPCTQLPHYRAFIIANLPNLENLDNIAVSDADKQAAQGMPLLQPATVDDVLAEDLEAMQSPQLQPDDQQAEKQLELETAQQEQPQQQLKAKPLQQQQQLLPQEQPAQVAMTTPPPPARQNFSQTPPMSAGGALVPKPLASLQAAQAAKRSFTGGGVAAAQPQPSPGFAPSAGPAASRLAGSAAALLDAGSAAAREAAASPEVGSERSLLSFSCYSPSPVPSRVDSRAQLRDNSDEVPRRSWTEQQLPTSMQQQRVPTPVLLQPASMCCHCAAQETPMQQQPQLQGQHHLARPSSSQVPNSTNVLYAVMALLAELDVSSLHIVQREIKLRLSGR